MNLVALIAHNVMGYYGLQWDAISFSYPAYTLESRNENTVELLEVLHKTEGTRSILYFQKIMSENKLHIYNTYI